MADPQTYSDALALAAAMQTQLASLISTWADKSAQINDSTMAKCSPGTGKVVISGHDALGKPISISLTPEEATGLSKFLTSIGV